MCLLGIINPDASEQAKADAAVRKIRLTELLVSFGPGFAGIAFTPALLAEKPKNITLGKFEEAVKRFEESGLATVLSAPTDFHEVARLRERMREDMRSNPGAFVHLPRDKRKVGVGDAAIVYSALKTQSDELWTYDATLLAFDARPSVRMVQIVEPRPLVLQGKLPV